MLLHTAFIRTAKKKPSHLSVYDISSSKEFTYERMLIASFILSRKISAFPEAHIGIMLPTSAGCMLSILGVLMSGKIPVMLNYSTGAKENCEYGQNKCNFTTIITSKKLLEAIKMQPIKGMVYIEDMLKQVTLLDKILCALKAKLPGKMIIGSLPKKTREDTAVILFTSGSEKDPKAVELSHKNISTNLRDVHQILRISPDDIFLANLPLFHVFGLTVDMWLPICGGNTIIAHANPLDYKGICDSIRKHKVSVMVGTPTFYHGYLKKSEKGDFDTVRIAVAGADKLTRQIREEYLHMHNLEVCEGYGATETSPVISTNLPGRNKPGSVGIPLPSVSVKIVDRETSEELPRGEEGKIMVKGDNVMKGYYHDIEETSLRIHNNWYETGDMGVLDEDGYLWHRGRLKRFVKIGGEMVSLVRVETVLEKLLPEGTICCAVDIPNPVKGSEIVAVVTTEEINVRHIKKQMAKELPSLAIPKEFHVIQDIPMMSSGKVNFREVESICRDWRKKKKQGKN